VVDARGKQAGSHVVATNGQEIVECLRAIPGQRHVCFEEGTQSGWLYEILEPHAVEVVVAGVAAGSRGPKDDKRDAFGLAEDLRLGAIKIRVFKNGGPYKALRELARTHRMVVRDVVRTKNRIKSMYRSRGVVVAGKSVYSSTDREPWQEQLPEACRGPVRTLYAELDALEEVRSDAERALPRGRGGRRARAVLGGGGDVAAARAAQTHAWATQGHRDARQPVALQTRQQLPRPADRHPPLWKQRHAQDLRPGTPMPAGSPRRLRSSRCSSSTF
jgi:hypothetical protein